jgi:hypothetical protein
MILDVMDPMIALRISWSWRIQVIYSGFKCLVVMLLLLLLVVRCSDGHDLVPSMYPCKS